MSSFQKYLFFETETTGIPQNYKAPCTDTNNWPRLIQLGWLLTDAEGQILSEGNHIVRPEGFEIPKAASDVHGITTEIALAEGQSLLDVIFAFGTDLNQSDCVVRHNLDYDLHVLGAEYVRLGYDSRIMFARPTLCTMQATIDYCNIPGAYGPKWPKLMELYTKLFGKGFDGAHDAMADIVATKECFFELLRRGIVRLQ